MPLYYWRILLTRQFSLLIPYESTNQAFAWFTVLARNLHWGTSLLWNPYSFSGHPFLDETQNGAFYPVNLLLALFPLNRTGLYSVALYHWQYALAHLAASCFMYLLLRELELSVFASVIGGIGFGVGGIMHGTGGWMHLAQGLGWTPFVMLFLVRALKQNSGRAAALMGATAGGGIALALLAGSLYSAIVQSLLLVALVGYAVLERRATPLRGSLIAGAAALTAVCGSAAQLFPSIVSGSYTLRTLGPTMLLASQKIPYQYVKDGVWPHSFLAFFLFGPGSFSGGSLAAGEVPNPYLGSLLFILAMIGVWKRWNNPVVRLLTGLTAFSCLYALGFMSAVHGILYAVVPQLWVFREPGRMMYLSDFALAALAAFGTDALFAADSGSWRHLLTALKWLALICGGALVLSALYTSKFELNPWLSLALVLILASAALIARVAHGGWRPGIRWLFVGLLLFELYAFDWDAYTVATEQAKNQDQFQHLSTFQPVARFLRKQPGPFRVEVVADQRPNVGDAFAIEAKWGSGATVISRYWDFNDRNFWNVRFIVRPASAGEPGPVYSDANWKVYPAPAPGPRAWLVHSVSVPATHNELVSAVRSPAFDPLREAVLETPLRTPLPPASGEGDKVTLDRYDPTAPSVLVATTVPSLLVFSEVDTPGWVATVNASPAPVVSVDGALRGVLVPAGQSRVEMHYRPTAVFAGLAVSGLFWPCLIAAWIWWRKTNKIPASSEDIADPTSE